MREDGKQWANASWMIRAKHGGMAHGGTFIFGYMVSWDYSDKQRLERLRELGALSAVEVLAGAGFAVEELDRLGVMVERTDHRWTRKVLAYGAKDHLFAVWESQWIPMVKPGHEQAFLGLLKDLRNGAFCLLPLPPHVNSGRLRNGARQAERAARHQVLLARLAAELPVRPPARPELPHQAETFLKRWAEARTKEVYFADGMQGLLETRLKPVDRFRIVSFAKPQYVVERLNGGADGVSGYWLFQRPLFREGIVVEFVLHVDADGHARCAWFGVPGNAQGFLEHYASLSLDLEEESAHCVEVTSLGRPVKGWVLAARDRVTGVLCTTTELDKANAERLRKLYAACASAREVAELLLLQQSHERLLDEDLDNMFGWRSGRWQALRQGARPKDDERAAIRALLDPEVLHGTASAEVLGPEVRKKWAAWKEVVRGCHRDHVPLLAEAFKPTVFNGFQQAYTGPVGELVVCIADELHCNLQELWSVVFLCDMHHYRTRGAGFTGLHYRATADGPVFDAALSVLHKLHEEEFIARFDAEEFPARTYLRADRYRYPDDFRAYHTSMDLLKELGLFKQPKAWRAILDLFTGSAHWRTLVKKHSEVPYDIALWIKWG